jgi:hypothetical protein
MVQNQEAEREISWWWKKLMLFSSSYNWWKKVELACTCGKKLSMLIKHVTVVTNNDTITKNNICTSGHTSNNMKI